MILAMKKMHVNVAKCGFTLQLSVFLTRER